MPAANATSPLAEPVHRRAVGFLVERGPVGGYADRGEPASEPTAWATLALAADGQQQAALLGAEWLAQRQQPDGSVGVTLTETTPAWPTSLAMLAWQATDPDRFAERIERGAAWALGQKPWTEARHRVFGHDTTLEGWSWAPHTHSWLEPTAFFVAALRAAGLAGDARHSQGVRLLVDRLLPSGGVNYGNTVVLGQELLQHLQPSGVVAWALADEGVDDPRLGATIEYLQHETLRPTGVASLAFGVLGLAAHGAAGDEHRAALASAWPRAERAGGVYKPALVALAAQAMAGHAMSEGGR